MSDRLTADNIRQRYKLEVQELEDWDQLAAQGYEQAWWRKIIEAIKKRQHSFLNQLVEGGLEKDAEDKLRGAISEDQFFILLDERAHQLHREKLGGS